jgi:fatty acid desaturase
LFSWTTRIVQLDKGTASSPRRGLAMLGAHTVARRSHEGGRMKPAPTARPVAAAPPEDRPRIKPAVLEELCRVSTWRSFAAIAIDYGLVVVVAAVCSGPTRWWLSPIAMLVVASRQMSLYSMLHEASHHKLHPNRRANDLVGDLLCGVPIGMRLVKYRAFHLQHHKHTGHPELDPERRLYAMLGYTFERQGWASFLNGALLDLSGIRTLRKMRAFAEVMRQIEGPGAARRSLVPAVFWGVVLSASVALGVWVHLLVFWILPLAFIAPVLFQLHNYTEHTGAEGPSELERTFSCHYHPLVRMVIQPLWSGLHVEHHLFPRVPWYRLPDLHAVLRGDALFARRVHVVGRFFRGPDSLLRTMVIGRGKLAHEIAAEHAHGT